MGRRPQPEILVPFPVAEIVAALEAGAGERGDFVATVADLFEKAEDRAVVSAHSPDIPSARGLVRQNVFLSQELRAHSAERSRYPRVQTSGFTKKNDTRWAYLLI